jgi:predicted nuclease of restriction endonuclease-like (RecB) superfamily
LASDSLGFDRSKQASSEAVAAKRRAHVEALEFAIAFMLDQRAAASERPRHTRGEEDNVRPAHVDGIRDTWLAGVESIEVLVSLP